MATIILTLAIGYVLGSIPSGVWLGKAFKGIDIREHGSRSIGATNVFRVLGAKLAVAVLLVDMAKGLLACYLAFHLDLGDTVLTSGQLAVIAGLAAILGHLFPVFAQFRGGKGVATAAGMLLFLTPLEVGFALVVFVLTVAITRYVSLGSILGSIFFSSSVLIERYYLGYTQADEISALAILLVILVLFAHRANIRRLLSGSENRFGVRR
jgi:glycerol-3-phosphate acyltransferase PlsY